MILLMHYKIGDIVSFLSEKGTGVITHVLSNFRVMVKNEDGFEISYSVDELVPIADKSKYKMDTGINEKWIDGKKGEEEIKPPKLSHDEVWEVDLHLRGETESINIKGDHEKLLYQIKYFKKCMDAALVNRIKKIIFIHGVGKGTLKQEIIHALKNYDRVRHYDAPYKKYGTGALTVEII